MKKRIVASVAAVGLAALIGWRLHERLAGAQRAGARKGGEATTVELAPVVRGTIRDIGVFHGSLAARSEFTVSSRIAGRICELLADLGDTVTNGQAVARLDDADFVQAVAEAQAAVAVAEASIEEVRSTLKLARQELVRAGELRKRNMVSDSEFDAVQSQVDAQAAREKLALAQADQRRAALASARLRLSYATVTAAWSGGGTARSVGKRFVSEGVNVSAGDPLFLLVDLDPTVAVFDVTGEDYARLSPGQVVAIESDAFPGRRFAGTVARVAPRFEEASRQARVEVDVPNPEHRLKPGVFVRGFVEFARHDDAWLAPLSALTRRQGRSGLFVEQPAEGIARFVPVTAGIVSSNAVEILSPAVTGRVVTLGHHLLEDGGALRESAAAAPAPAAPGGGRGRAGTRP